jgi:hypothetical protein
MCGEKPMSYDPGFVGIDNTQDATLSNILLDNFIQFYDWGFLDKGGFNNISRPSSGMYGGSKHILKPVDDPNYSANQVWQAFRQNWVWETGVSKTTQPTQISGVYRGNTFLPFSYNATSGYYIGSGYTIDYPNGRVIFNSPIPATSVVSLNYSYKWASVQRAEGVPFFRQIQNGFRLDQNFLTGSGDWVQLGQTRVQLPAVFVESPKKRTYDPYQLGGGQWANTDIVVYVMSDKQSTCVDILDMISYQNDRDIKLFNTNSVSKSGDIAINYNGNLVDKSNRYPDLINNHYFRNCIIHETQINDPVWLSYSLYLGTAKFSTRVFV